MNTKILFAEEKIEKVPIHPSLKLSALVGERSRSPPPGCVVTPVGSLTRMVISALQVFVQLGSCCALNP